MELIINNENGKTIIDSKVFESIAEVSALKVKGIYPTKKNDFASCKINNDDVVLTLNVKLEQNIDVVGTCGKVQEVISEDIAEMCGVECKAINIDIQGFVKEEKK